MGTRNLNTDRDPSFTDHFYAPHTPWAKPEKSWLRLPAKYSFDLDQARHEFEKVRGQFPLKPFEVLSKEGTTRPRLSYRGIGLTARAGAVEPVYDALSIFGPDGKKLSIFHTFEKMSDKRRAEDREVEVLNEYGFTQDTAAYAPFFKETVSHFQAPITKVRFLEMTPGGFIPPHIDYPFYHGIRLHACLYSNPDVVWEVEGEQFSIPCDGNFYWFDTGRYHAVRNDGDESRIVLSVNLSPFVNLDGTSRLGPDHNLIELLRSGGL